VILVDEVIRKREDVERWADRLYSEQVDHKSADGFAAVFTSDGTLQFGNNPQLVGRDAIRTAIAQFFSAFETLRHHSGRTWLDGDTVILEAVVTYRRHDAQQVTVPAVTVFHLTRDSDPKNPLADACRIYVDLTPLFAP
jgi:hypothetical protein